MGGALERKAFGKHLAEFANIRDWIAESRVEIDQARLLVLRAAHRMDRQGNAAARVDVSAIKVVAARLQTRIVDRAIQVFGAMGLTPDTPLSYLWTWAVRCVFSTGQMKSTCVSYRDLNFQGRNAMWVEAPRISYLPTPSQRNEPCGAIEPQSAPAHRSRAPDNVSKDGFRDKG
jgi:hypothetical protein